jgi:hypothetical protein
VGAVFAVVKDIWQMISLILQDVCTQDHADRRTAQTSKKRAAKPPRLASKALFPYDSDQSGDSYNEHLDRHL